MPRLLWRFTVPSKGTIEGFTTSTDSTLNRSGTTCPSKPHCASFTSSADADAATKSKRQIHQERFMQGHLFSSRNIPCAVCDTIGRYRIHKRIEVQTRPR